jgi:YgiT-type zinc finger domain-containing protein
MKCVVCRQAETHPGKATVTLERENVTLVIKGVPAEVCPNCSEEYVNEEITRKLLKNAEEATQIGVHVDIRDYVAA